MDKVNDIYTELNEEIDISDSLENKGVSVENLGEINTNDIETDLDDVVIGSRKKTYLKEFKTKNFDGILKEKKLKNIDLVKRNQFLEKIKLIFSRKLSFSGKSLPVFSEKNFFSKDFFKKLGLFFLIISLILFIDKIIIENRVNSGYKKIISIKDNSSNLENVIKKVNSAKFDFILSDILYKPFLLIPNKNIENGYHIIKGGKQLANLLDNGIRSYKNTKEFIDSKKGIENIVITNLLSNLREDFSITTNNLYNTLVEYNKIENLGDIDLNNKLNFAKGKLNNSYKFFDIINKDFDIFLNLFGHSEVREYLIVFQNNDEIRPTGGFIGSLATIKVKNGKIINFKKDDVYAYEWEINKNYKNKKVAPEGLNKITKTFGLRDANYFINFENSSKTIKFFLEKMDKKIDGIVYINQKTALDFLKLIGGIEFKGVSETINESNFSLIISSLVEAKSFKLGTLGTPKKVLFDFIDSFIKKLKDKKDYFGYIDILRKNIISRDIVFYSFVPEENNLLWKLGLNGKINYNETIDFNYPVYTSIGGNKSDRYIELNYKKDVKINDNCSINTNLEIFRSHLFTKKEEEKVNKILDTYPIKAKSRKDLLNIQGRGVNKSFVRIVLPKDAIVFKKKGIKVYKYEDSTVIETYINTRLLETTNFNIDYKLNNIDCKKYSYKFYKQAGIIDYSLEINIGDELIKNKGITGDFILKKVEK